MSSAKDFISRRQCGTGGSDVAAIMGLSPWKSAVDVYLEKINPQADFSDNKILARGRRLEQYILQEYAEHHEVELDTSQSFIQDKELPFLIGHVDARIKGEKVLVEAKSVSGNPSIWHDGIPIYYLTQVAHYAAITDCERVDVPVLFDRWTYGCYSYYRDLAFEQSIRDACNHFWQEHVLKQIPPAPRSDADARSLYQISESKVCQANEQMQEALLQIKELSVQKDILSKKEEALRLQLMTTMADHDTLTDSQGKVLATWKTQTNKRLDMDALKQSNLPIYQQFLKPQTSRIFRIMKG